MPRRGIDLSEEQWRNVKALAAKRGQTISAWFGDVIMEMGIGRVNGKEYPSPATEQVQQEVRPRWDPRGPAQPTTAKERQANRDAILRKINRGG